jgi:ABC-type branched-subunit amino acid transport system permease subunit
MIAFVLGAGAAGLGGSLLVIYVGGWAPASWLPAESLVLLAAVLVGGRGRNAGAVLGATVVLGGIVEATRFLPVIGSVSLLPDLQIIAVAGLILAFLWWRPQGILPERKEKFRIPAIEASSEHTPPASELRSSAPERQRIS